MRLALPLLLAAGPPDLSPPSASALVGRLSVASRPTGLENAQSDIALPGITGGSDVWSHTAPGGDEYAVIGGLTGVTVVAVPSLAVAGHVDGASEGDPFFHRDITTYGGFAYVVTECTGAQQGLQAIGLRGLPARVASVAAVEGALRLVAQPRHRHTHPLRVRPQRVQRRHREGGPRRSAATARRGQIDGPDVHDVYARGDTLWIAEGTLTDALEPGGAAVARVTSRAPVSRL